MAAPRLSPQRRFSFADARALLPTIRRLTAGAQARLAELGTQGTEEALDQAQNVVQSWVESMAELEVGVKGLWMIDFDTGAGCYCWEYPEPDISYFYSYEDGFAGRVRIH